MSLDAVSFVSGGSISSALELVTAAIANPTELNAIGTAVPDWRLVRTNVAGSDEATLYRLDTSSDAVNAPYVMASLTAGLRWVAITGRYQNQSLTDNGTITGARVVASTSTASDAGFTHNQAVAGGLYSTLKNSNSGTGSFYQLQVLGDTGQGTLTCFSSTFATAALQNTFRIYNEANAALLLGANNTTWQSISGAGVINMPGTTSASSAITGTLTIGNGTAATNVGIGAGNINAGGTLINGGLVGLSGGSNSFADVTIGQTNNTSGTAQEALYINFTGTSAGTTLLIGNQCQLGTAASAYTVADAMQFFSSRITVGAGSAITRATNYYSRDHAGNPTNQAAFYHSANATPAYTGNWCLYIDGAYKNYLGTAATLINTTTDDGTNKLQVSGGIRTLATTEASSVSVAAQLSDGGLGVAKRSFLGTIGSTFKGNVTAGVQDATAAVVGQVGEEIKSTVSAAAVAATTTTGNITSISLTAGDWLLSGYCVITGGATGLTVNTTAKMSIVTTTATDGTSGDTMVQESVLALLANGLFTMSLPAKRVNINTTTTYYLTENVTFAAGSPTVAATLTATRVR